MWFFCWRLVGVGLVLPKRFSGLRYPFLSSLAKGNRYVLEFLPVCACWQFWIRGFCSPLSRIHRVIRKPRELTTMMFLKVKVPFFPPFGAFLCLIFGLCRVFKFKEERFIWVEAEVSTSLFKPFLVGYSATYNPDHIKWCNSNANQ